MSVRPPTSKSKTEEFSSVAEKIKALKERKKKGNPFSPTNKKITQQIKKLEQSQKPVSEKFKYTGKKIGDKKTKTGQFVPKPKVLSASDKRKIETEKRDAQSRLKLQQQIKDLKRKGQDVKARKASERLEDIPPVRKPKTYGGELTPKKVVKPVSKVVPKKVVKPVSKVVSDKTTVKSKPKNRLQLLKERGKATSPKIGEVSTGTSTTKFPRVHPSRQTKVKPTTKKYSPVESSAKTYGGELTPKKVVKKQSPSKLAKITPKRKPKPLSVNGSKVKSKSNGVPLYPRPTSTANKKAISAKMAATLPAKKDYKYKGDPALDPRIKKSAKKDYKYKGDPALDPSGKPKAKTIAKTPKKSEEGFLGFKQISGKKDWSGGIREYETPFGNITLDSSQENLTDEQKERKKIGLSYKKGGQIKVPKKKKVGKKKQGYKARKDESIAMRVKKKRTKKQLKASRSDSYGKFGKGKGKGKINRSGAALVAASYD